MNRPRIARADLDTLRRLAEGWCPLNAQIPIGMALERRGLLRLDWGPQGTPDEDRMCWYLTDRARALLDPPVPP